MPMVQHVDKPRGQYVNAMSPLFDAMESYTPQQKNIIKSRFIPMIDATEREAQRAEWWDTRMFLIGFGASLAVTIAAAINIATFITPVVRDSIGAAVLGISSIGTAALGLRERLKFQEVSIISKKMSNKLQRHGFLFLAAAEPYDGDRGDAYVKFIAHTERIKLQADEDQMKLKMEKEDAGHVGAGFSTFSHADSAIPDPLQTCTQPKETSAVPSTKKPPPLVFFASETKDEDAIPVDLSMADVSSPKAVTAPAIPKPAKGPKR